MGNSYDFYSNILLANLEVLDLSIQYANSTSASSKYFDLHNQIGNCIWSLFSGNAKAISNISF